MSRGCESKTYYAMSLDPIHIGTGGYRLGRVDNTIVREAGTNLPKIPGTSIEGTARTYVYYAEEESVTDHINEACAVGKKSINNEEEPCGKCPVCVTFGFTKKDKSLHGMAQFNDARILFFPVHSMIGPVWVTCPSILKEISEKEFKKENIPVLISNKELRKEEIIVSSQIKENHNIQKLNLGFLYLNIKDKQKFTDNIGKFSKFKDILERLVVVNNDIFEKIVNSNLEVRTSVSIDPQTGAAEEGALFTYEAIPRATIFWFDVVVNDPNKFDINSSEIDSPQKVIKEVEKSFDYFKTLGIGGMQTKGFGRLKILNGGSNGSE